MKIQERRIRLEGHIHWHLELVANYMLLWEPNHGVRSRGRPAMTYILIDNFELIHDCMTLEKLVDVYAG